MGGALSNATPPPLYWLTCIFARKSSELLWCIENIMPPSGPKVSGFSLPGSNFLMCAKGS